jgi:hypothetical protein
MESSRSKASSVPCEGPGNSGRTAPRAWANDRITLTADLTLTFGQVLLGKELAATYL